VRVAAAPSCALCPRKRMLGLVGGVFANYPSLRERRMAASAPASLGARCEARAASLGTPPLTEAAATRQYCSASAQRRKAIAARDRLQALEPRRWRSAVAWGTAYLARSTAAAPNHKRASNRGLERAWPRCWCEERRRRVAADRSVAGVCGGIPCRSPAPRSAIYPQQEPPGKSARAPAARRSLTGPMSSKRTTGLGSTLTRTPRRYLSQCEPSHA
jgi:hypothetical protein